MITEKPVTFGRSGSLVGIVCAPAQPPATAQPTVVFINAGIIHRVGPNRLYVNLARALARRGVRSLRFDLGGIGDSTTARDERGSADEIVYRDARDAIDFAAADNHAGVVLIGLCSGADYAFQSAVDDARVVGAVLLDPNIHLTRGFYVRHVLRALRSTKTWRLLLTGDHPAARRLARMTGSLGRSAERAPFLAPTSLPEPQTRRAQLDSLLDRGCHLFYVFTGGLPYRYNHRRQFATNFPASHAREHVAFVYRPEWDHTFSAAQAQKDLEESIGEWFARSFVTASPAARAG